MIGYRARLENLPGGIITETTIQRMHEQVRKAKQDWEWIRLATWIVRGVRSKDYNGEAKRFFDIFHHLIWGIGSYRYTRDPNQVETVESPWHLLERKASDCDGWAVFYAALVGALGFPYRFKTINADPARPNSPSHVYTQVKVNSGWKSSDLTVKEAFFGWEPPDTYKFQLWDEPRYD